MLHTLFLPKQGDVDGHPYPASSMALEVDEEMQYRLEGFIEAEVERYADELAEADEEGGMPSDNEGTVRGDSDDEGTQKKKPKPKKKPTGDAGVL